MTVLKPIKWSCSFKSSHCPHGDRSRCKLIQLLPRFKSAGYTAGKLHPAEKAISASETQTDLDCLGTGSHPLLLWQAATCSSQVSVNEERNRTEEDIVLWHMASGTLPLSVPTSTNTMSRLSLSGSILFSALTGAVTAVCWLLFTVTGYTPKRGV